MAGASLFIAPGERRFVGPARNDARIFTVLGGNLLLRGPSGISMGDFSDHNLDSTGVQVMVLCWSRRRFSRLESC